MSDFCEVAIVGAGPYGLSVAAHLQASGVQCRTFGETMRPWRASMPQGMYLKSQGFASNLSSPDGAHTLERFCSLTGRDYATYGLPVALETFTSYGSWFQRELVPDVEETLVIELGQRDGHFQLALADGRWAEAEDVVVAAGVDHFAWMPEELSSLPSWACTHSSAHDDLSVFLGKQVIVVGAGQSALESAALLHEAGVGVTVVARTPKLRWNGPPLSLDRRWWQQLREPEAGLGSGWATWLYSERPQWFRSLPRGTRVRRARTALGPAGAPWLRPRVEGKLPVLLGQRLQWARAEGGRVCLGVEDCDGVEQELTADHVIAATGYRTDLGRLRFLGNDLRKRIETLAGSPVVDRRFRSSVPGLHFVGPTVAPSHGPVMRFVYGTSFAAPSLAGQLIGKDGRRQRVLAGTSK